MSPLEMIAAERRRQVESECFSTAHDDGYKNEELAAAAAAYCIPHKDRVGEAAEDFIAGLWPWEGEWWKPIPTNRLRELQKAGALIVAEMERIQRLEDPLHVEDEAKRAGMVGREEALP